jgi:HEPN domain-containing protein
VFAVTVSLSAYLFAWDLIRIESRFSDRKSLRSIRKLADVFYFVGMALPVFVMVVWLTSVVAQFLIKAIGAIPEDKRQYLLVIINALVSIVAGMIVGYASKKYALNKAAILKAEEQARFRLNKERSLENAERLYKQKFYSSSILEAYKVLEIEIRAALARSNIYLVGNVPPFALFDQAVKEGIISRSDSKVIEDIRKLRNRVAHLDVGIDKKQADLVLKGVRHILEKVAKNGLED